MNKPNRELRQLRRLPPALALVVMLAHVSSANAHPSGHGQKISGKGPNGGALAPIVLASEADLGERADTAAIAEWVKRDQSIEIYLWNKNQKGQIHFSAPTQMKWILLGGSMSPPKIINVTVKETQNSVRQKFDRAALDHANTVEVVISRLGSTEKKHVFSFQMKKQN